MSRITRYRSVNPEPLPHKGADVRTDGAARRTVVPTIVRVETGWDRTVPAAATIDRLAIADVDLDRSQADAAARIRAAHGVSPVDAHLGAVIQHAGSDDVVVLTSDPGDLATVAEGHPTNIIPL